MRYHTLTAELIQKAGQKAREFGHSWVGCAHLLTAMTELHDGTGQFLRSLGLDPMVTEAMAQLLCGVGTPGLPLEKLAGMPFISMTPETDTYQRVSLICQASGFTPNTILSFSQQSTAFNMACAGLGFTFISDTLVKNARFRPELVFYKIESRESHRHIKLFLNASRRISYAARAFLEMAK